MQARGMLMNFTKAFESREIPLNNLSQSIKINDHVLTITS